MDLTGKVAIVTGGVKGIGLAIVTEFLNCGATVVVADYDDKNLGALSSLNNKNLRFLKVDVSSDSEVELLIERTVKTFGKLDIMVANAGVSSEMPINYESIENYKRVIDIDQNGVFFCCKYAIEQMLKQENGGSIVNVASILGLVGNVGAHSYTAAKGAIVNLTRSLGVTYSKNKIRVNAVAPGYIETPLTEVLTEEQKNAQIKLHPIGRAGKPEEVAKAVCFLASDDASFITGSILPVDGGYTAI